MQEIYVRFHREEETDPSLTDKAREWFAKLEKGDEEATELFSFFKKSLSTRWKKFTSA